MFKTQKKTGWDFSTGMVGKKEQVSNELTQDQPDGRCTQHTLANRRHFHLHVLLTRLVVEFSLWTTPRQKINILAEQSSNYWGYQGSDPHYSIWPPTTPSDPSLLHLTFVWIWPSSEPPLPSYLANKFLSKRLTTQLFWHNSSTVATRHSQCMTPTE